MIFLFIKQTLIWKEQAQHSVFYICVYTHAHTHTHTHTHIYILILTLMRLLSSECKIFNYIWICICMYAKLLQLCPTLCNPLDYSQPVSYVHWISQAKILEWVAMPSSRGSSWLRDQTLISYVSCIGRGILYHQLHVGSPYMDIYKAYDSGKSS